MYNLFQKSVSGYSRYRKTHIKKDVLVKDVLLPTKYTKKDKNQTITLTMVKSTKDSNRY